jgi:hypothetical protein
MEAKLVEHEGQDTQHQPITIGDCEKEQGKRYIEHPSPESYYQAQESEQLDHRR